MPSPFDVLAVQRLGDLEVLVPGLRRLQAGFLQHVRAVVDHVEVAIERDQVGLAVVLRREVAEERRRSSSHSMSLSSAMRGARSSR